MVIQGKEPGNQGNKGYELLARIVGGHCKVALREWLETPRRSKIKRERTTFACKICSHSPATSASQEYLPFQARDLLGQTTTNKVECESGEVT